MLYDYFSLALKNLKQRGLRSWLTMLGVFIGIAAVVSLITMGQGLEAAVQGQFGGLATDRLTIQNRGTGFGPPGSTVVEKLNENDLEVIESVRGIERVVPQLVRVTEIEFNKVSGFTFIADIPNDKDQADYIYEADGFEVEVGRLLEETDSGKVVLGHDFLEEEDFGKDFRIGKKILVNNKEFEIIGFLEQSDTFTLNSVVFMTTDDLKDVLDIEDEFDLIVVQVEDTGDIAVVASEIERKLRDDRNEDLGEETFTVETPEQALESVNTILNIINLIVVGIAMISLFVGGIGIANTMYTSVVERTKEIGVMKAIGAQNKDVLSIFLIESGLLGLVGGIVGAIIGLGGALLIADIANQALGGDLFKVVISYPLIIGAISFSFFVGVLSGILPALQASKLNVVDALRS